MHSFMLFQMSWCVKTFITCLTLERFFTWMNTLFMSSQSSWIFEAFTTVFALVRSCTCMNSFMPFPISWSFERDIAYFTGINFGRFVLLRLFQLFFERMYLFVQSQVLQKIKRFVTCLTLKFLFICMNWLMPMVFPQYELSCASWRLQIGWKFYYRFHIQTFCQCYSF